MELKIYDKGYTQIKVEQLVYADWNYKDVEGDEVENLLDALENNFKRNGQIENILVRRLETGFYEVVNGNHRVMVARRLGLTELMCFNLGEISEVHAKRIALETNETKFKGSQLKIAEIMRELDVEFDTEELLSTMPYDENELDNFNKLLTFDWEDYKDGEGDAPNSGEGSNDDEFKVLRFDLPKTVAHQFEEQLDRFKKILYPKEKPSDVSPIMPIEAMIQCLHQIPDHQITGEANGKG